MPLSFWFAIVLFIVAIGAVITRYAAKRTLRSTDTSSRRDTGNVEQTKFYAGVTAAVALGLVVVLTLFASVKIVSTKNVGVETTFGQTTGDLSNGLHFTAPWTQVTEMDAAIQTNTYDAGQNPGCLTVRVADQATGCVNVLISWRIQPNAADSLFQDYHDFSNVESNLVTPELKQDLNAVFGTYDPLAINSQGVSTNPSYAQLSTDVQQMMTGKIGTNVQIKSVVISLITFDPNMEQRITSLQVQIANTLIAKEAILTNQAQAQAYQALQATLANNSSGVLESQCLSDLLEAINKNYPLPAGFNCLGASSAVVVPSTGK